MRAFEWEQRYCLAIAPMDREHRVLIAMMQRLYDRNRAGAPHEELRAILAELASATRAHFVNEEQYLDAIGYGDVERHKAVHATLLDNFEEHRQRFEASGGSVPRELFSFLKLWLAAHIEGIDRRYADYERARRQSLPSI